MRGAKRQDGEAAIRRALIRMDPGTLAWRLLTLAWAAHIFWMSTESFGPQMSRSLLAQMLALLHVSVSASALETINTILRKLAHVVEYAVFGFLLCRSFGDRDRIRWQRHVAGWSLVIAAVYSLSDELHQAFVPGRGPSLIDCGIDVTGAAVGMLLVYGGSWVLKRKGPNGAAP